MREDLTKILPIIEKLDKPTSQILIKANIVETTKGVARDLGIMWGGYNRSTQGKEDLIVTGWRFFHRRVRSVEPALLRNDRDWA